MINIFNEEEKIKEGQALKKACFAFVQGWGDSKDNDAAKNPYAFADNVMLYQAWSSGMIAYFDYKEYIASKEVITTQVYDDPYDEDTPF